MLHYTQLYSGNQKSKPLRDATRNNLNLSKRNTKADISAPQYYSTARLRSNSSAGHSRTNLALYGTNLTNSNECYEKENNMTLTALAQNNLQILNEIDEDNFGRPKMFQTSIVPGSKSSANLLQKKLHLENFYYRKGSDTRPQTTLSSSRRYHIEPAEDQDSLLGSRKVTLYNRDINATLLSNQKSMSIVDMQLNTQNSNAPSLYSRFTKNCATPQQQKNAGNKSLVSLKPAVEAEAARRESFINKIQQNLVKNKMNTTLQNNDKKRSSNAFNDEVTKKHLAKISKMTAAISHIPEKKKSIPSHFLLKDLCSGMDNAKVVMDSTIQKEPTLESLSNSQVRQRRLSGNRTMQNSPPKILTERPSGVNIFHLVRNFQQYNEVKKELNQSTAKAAPTTAVQTQTLDCYKFDRLLGQGSYAIVKLATERATGVQVAIKTYEKQKLTDPRKMKNVRREISILKETNHPNVIKLHCSFETSKQIHLVMEYVGKTSLYSYLKTKTGRQVGENEARRMFGQLCSGMSYVHAKKIVHRDLKLENVLLDDNNNIKIIDFGFSICIDPETKLNIFCGTPSYMAPEIVAKSNYKGSPADVWALGILLYTMLCGKFPFRGFDEKDLFNKIKKGKFDIPMNLGSDARHLLEKILKVHPSERPTVDEILKDKWFQQ